MDPNLRITWVLGSGFSVPLGGPTLSSLFSLASRVTIPKIFSNEKYPQLHGDYLHAVYKIYELGYSNSDNKVIEMWTDAEQYLEFLDMANESPHGPAAVRLDYIIEHAKFTFKIEKKRLINTTRRIIAAECSVFLENTSTEFEKWQPYVRWNSMLNSMHTVITFNYDRVLEILAERKEMGGISYDSFVEVTGYKPVNLKAKNLPEVVKLHGSVDWRIETSNSKLLIVRGNPLEALECEPDQLGIATPGPTKRSMVSKLLQNIWYAAEDALQRSNIVIFIGYRFPETDAEARGRLLGALTENSMPNLKLYTVLGPNDDPATRRLEALLQYATMQRQAGPGKVIRIPLWAQDFMSVYQPELLLK